MTMAQWTTKLDDILRFNERLVLVGAGDIAADIAKQKATSEYENARGRPRRRAPAPFTHQSGLIPAALMIAALRSSSVSTLRRNAAGSW